jgi:hypothetical protein
MAAAASKASPLDKHDRVQALLRTRFRGACVTRSTKVQTLWGGYGEILRLQLKPGDEGREGRGPTPSCPSSVIVKRVVPPSDNVGGGGGQRKCKSYQVEQFFYEHFATLLEGTGARVPTLLASDRSTHRGETLFLLEDLDAAGFAERRHSLTLSDARACVTWLAKFHKTFLDKRTSLGDAVAGGVWAQGSYWHLETRPDELESMRPGDPLKQHAGGLDTLLRRAKHQTLLHGDAKVENFCFGKVGGVGACAAVDFQYTGWGIGLIDVAYCIGAFPAVDNLAKNEAVLLDLYFKELDGGPEVEAEWRALYCVCVADFERFLTGWSGESKTRRRELGTKITEALALCG